MKQSRGRINLKISTTRLFGTGSSRTKGSNRIKGQDIIRILQDRVVVTVARTMKLLTVVKPLVFVSGVGQWTLQSEIAQLYQIKAIEIRNRDKPLLITNHQLDNLSKANNKSRIRMLVLHSKIEMHKEDKIRHGTGHSSKDGYTILTV